ncbi:SH3 domain protein, partial [Cooperia oncophora]
LRKFPVSEGFTCSELLQRNFPSSVFHELSEPVISRSSNTHNSEPTSFSRDSGFVDNRLSQTSSSVRQLTSDESSINRTVGSARSDGYLCTADKIPKGSQTYRALYPYTPTKDDEVALEVNDIIFVVEKCDDGWFIGTVLRTGQFGTFPGNYVERH